MPFATAANPMFPLWVVLPASLIAVLSILFHLTSLTREPMPASRRRIRMATGVVLLALTLLITYAVGFVEMLPEGGGSIGHVRTFVLVWMAIMGLVPLVLALAGLDVVNTVKLQRATAREMRRRMQMEAMRQVEIHVRGGLGRAGAAGGRGGEHHGG